MEDWYEEKKNGQGNGTCFGGESFAACAAPKQENNGENTEQVQREETDARPSATPESTR